MKDNHAVNSHPEKHDAEAPRKLYKPRRRLSDLEVGRVVTYADDGCDTTAMDALVAE